MVDAKSSDNTVAVASSYGCRVLRVAAPSRGAQLRLGASNSCGEYLWFLHADEVLIERPGLVQRMIRVASKRECAAAYFTLNYQTKGTFFRFLERTANLRARLSGHVFGDQGMFMRRDIYWCVGGFPDVPIMEDLLLSRQLSRYGKWEQLPDKLVASSRKYDTHPWQTHFKILRIRALFICGFSTERIFQMYYGKGEN